VYAKWTKNAETTVTNYTLRFEAREGSPVDPVTCAAGTKVDLTDKTTTRDGYTFDGWYADKDCTGDELKEITVNSDMTVYAKWKAKTEESKTTEPTTTEKPDPQEPEPEKPEPEKPDPETPTEPTVTYYTLTYVPYPGAEEIPEQYPDGTAVDLTRVPVREGYQFTGWYKDEALTIPITSVVMTEDRTVYGGWEAATVPELLNGDDHFAYVIGDTEGTVRPEDSITRAEIATIFFRLLKAEVRDGNLTTENPFTDVAEDAWYCKAVSTLTALGIITGRTATEFAPDEPITRAELATVCARFDTGITSGNSSFSDIEGHWAQADIEKAASLGWLLGYEDGTFRPDNEITRAEAMTMINRVLCRIPENTADLLKDMKVWPDNRDTTQWYYLAVQEATNSHAYTRKGEIYETWAWLEEDPDWTRYQK
jgi:uncharacterized repeat protein (TIGR02543 family)